jgi:hypothetical protein
MDVLIPEIAKHPMTRRAFLAATAGAAVLPATAGAQDATATPDKARIDAVVALSQALVGGGRIDPNRAAQYMELNDADPDDKALLDQLLTVDPANVAATPAAHPMATPILLYWYLGEHKGVAVPERDTFWYGLSSWQAVKYTSSTSICKRFGDWAEAPKVV